MLVFVMPTSYPNKDNPIANAFVKDQVKVLSKKCQVIVLNVQKQSTKNIYKKINNKVFYVNDGTSEIVCKKQKTFLENIFVFVNQLFFNKSMKKVYVEAVKKYGKPDLIYAHFFSAGYAALKIVKKENIPVLVLEHAGALISPKLDWRKKKLLKYTVDNCNLYVSTTPSLKKYVELHTKTKKSIPVIPNMVDDLFSYCPPINKNTFEFFSVSRFDYDKRIDLLIEAFCKAFSSSDRVSLSIGGEGKEFESIKGLVEEKKRGDQIKLLGRLTREQVFENMVLCDSFVLPSRHETFGLVWREAMCIGRPVITTDHGGFGPEDWKNSFGVMISVDDESALCDSMKFVKNNYYTFDLKKISEDNLEMYSSKKIAEKIFLIFQDVVRGNE